ncbi:hypothetical protein [Paenibacillus sp. Z3-2]
MRVDGNRKQFVATKVDESHLLDSIPQVWRVSFLHFFDKYMMKTWDFISTLTCKTSFSDPSLLLNLPNLKKVRLSGSEVNPEAGSFKVLEELMLQREGNLIMK